MTILTAFGSIATSVKAIKLGADNYILKPCSFSELMKSFQNITGKLIGLAVLLLPRSSFNQNQIVVFSKNFDVLVSTGLSNDHKTGYDFLKSL